MSEASLLQSIAQTLYTAVLSDVLDELGFREQAMPPSIRPLDDERVMVGRARTALSRGLQRIPGDNPYALEIARVADLSPASSRCSDAAAPRASRRGASSCPRRRAHAAPPAASRTGSCATSSRFAACAFRCYGGAAPLDSKGRGKVAEIDVPIRRAGVAVSPGDLVVGDADGVIVDSARRRGRRARAERSRRFAARTIRARNWSAGRSSPTSLRGTASCNAQRRRLHRFVVHRRHQPA